MKKLPTLHVLNGDARVPAFTEAAFSGEMMVWREILASGPAVYAMPDEAFWEMRSRYITETFQVPESDYEQQLLNELSKLERAGQFFEVVLWFDQDLVCQINLLYLLHRLSHLKPNLVAVCTPEGTHTAYQKQEMQHLFENRKMPDTAQLQQAAMLWQLYAGPDPMALQAYLLENELFSSSLKQALSLHLQRFPDQDTNLGAHQKLLLASLDKGSSTIEDIQKSFWKYDPGYGFGDWQLQALLKAMSPELVHLNGTEVSLTEHGKQVLDGKIKYNKKLTCWLGGVSLNQHHPAWCRNAESGEIILCTD